MKRIDIKEFRRRAPISVRESSLGWLVYVDMIIDMNFTLLHLIAAHSLHSFDSRRHYPADVAGYKSRCPSGKFRNIGVISALFILIYHTRSDGRLCSATHSRVIALCEAWSAGLNIGGCLRLINCDVILLLGSNFSS